MKLSELCEKYEFTPLTDHAGLDNEWNGVYIGDLLSWVMGRGKEGALWITIQGHINIVAVATLIGFSCIIVAEGADINSDTIEKANQEEIPILATKMDAYEIAKILIKLEA